mgnify:CR=1 FL=1
MLSSNLNVKKQIKNAKYVTRRAKQRKAYTTYSLGTTAQVILPSTTVRHLTYKEMKRLKTTKFIQSKPVLEFKGEIPF